MPSIRRVFLVVFCISLLGAPMRGAAPLTTDAGPESTDGLADTANGAPTANAP